MMEKMAKSVPILTMVEMAKSGPDQIWSMNSKEMMKKDIKK